MRHSVFLLLFATYAAEARAPADKAQELEQTLNTHVAEYSLAAPNFAEALYKISGAFKVPMGIEWIKAPDTFRRIALSWHGDTVLEMIQSVVNAYADYELKSEAGVLEVFPRGSFGDARNVMNLRIPVFVARNESLALASRRLQKMVQNITGLVPPPAPGVGEAGSFVIGAGGDKKVTVKSEDAALRDILNKFTISAGDGLWVITDSEIAESRDDPFRPTLNLYSAEPVPKEYQPFWVFIPWGLDISVK